MSEALDKVLNNVDRINRVHSYFVSLGSTDEQAATAAKAFAEKFVYDGAVLSFQGKPVIDARDDVIAHFRENKLDFLLPAPNADNVPDVDADTLASARAGNLTAYARIARDHGKATADKLIAAKPGDEKSKEDASTNPWRAPDFRTERRPLKRKGSGHYQIARHWRRRTFEQGSGQDARRFTVEGSVT